MRKSKFILALLLALTLPFAPARFAFADEVSTLEAEVKKAEEKLKTLGEAITSVAEEANEQKVQLEKINDKIDDLTEDIEKAEENLEDKQKQLAKSIASDYKSNYNLSFLALLLNSTSIEDLTSNAYYLSKIHEHTAKNIEEIDETKAELEDNQKKQKEAKSEQVKVVEAQENILKNLEKEEEEQKKYSDSLSKDLKDAIEKKHQEELKQQREEAERLLEEASRNALNNAINPDASENEDTDKTSSNELSTDPEKVETENTYSFLTLSLAQRQKILEAAFSQLGVPYVYGSMAPGKSFDCSGLTSWAYSQAGVAIPHSAASQARYINEVGYLQPGDLVVWLGGMNALSGNHVAIYIGGGQIIHASYSGVSIASLGYMRAWSKAGCVRIG